jgi:hypothetical protein
VMRERYLARPTIIIQQQHRLHSCTMGLQPSKAYVGPHPAVLYESKERFLEWVGRVGEPTLLREAAIALPWPKRTLNVPMDADATVQTRNLATADWPVVLAAFHGLEGLAMRLAEADFSLLRNHPVSVLGSVSEFAPEEPINSIMQSFAEPELRAPRQLARHEVDASARPHRMALRLWRALVAAVAEGHVSLIRKMVAKFREGVSVRLWRGADVGQVNGAEWECDSEPTGGHVGATGSRNSHVDGNTHGAAGERSGPGLRGRQPHRICLGRSVPPKDVEPLASLALRHGAFDSGGLHPELASALHRGVRLPL